MESAEEKTETTSPKGLKYVALTDNLRERSGSVVECLTRDREAAGSNLTGVHGSLDKTHLS